MGTVNKIEQPVLFFDGVCNLCNSSVLFVIERDVQQRYRFASLQSDFAKKSLPDAFTEAGDYKSLILKEGNTLKTKSSAVLEIARHLKGAWRLLYVFIIIPKFVRDFVYDIVARNRYKWFGKKNECMIPTPNLQARFVE